MGSKLIVIVVFVTLGLIFPVLSKSPSCKGSEEMLAGLLKLEANRSEAISGRIDAYAPIYYILEKLAVEYIFDLKPKTPDDNADAINAEALRRYKEGIDYVLGSISFALGRCCNGIDTTRDEIYAYVEDGLATVAPLMALIQSGNYGKNRAAIDAYKTEVQNGVAAWVRKIYKLICTCLNTSDTDALAAIKTSENGSLTGIRHAVNAFFNAIKFIGIATSHGDKSLDLLDNVRECRAKTFAGVREEVYHEYAIVEALYVNSCFKQAGFVSDSTAIQYSKIVRADGTSRVAVFNVMINQANRIRFGFDDDGEQVFSRTDAAQAGAVAAVNAVINQLLDSILFVYPEYSCAVADGRKAAPGRAEALTAGYFDMVSAALDRSKNCSTVIREININKNKAVSVYTSQIQSFVTIVQKNQTCNDQTGSKFRATIDRAINEAVKYVLTVRDGAVILARIAHTDKTICTDDILAIQATKIKGISILTDYMNTMGEAFQFLLSAGNQSSP